MKYLIFDAGPIGRNQKEYKAKSVCNNTLSPQYLFGHAGFYIYFLRCFYG